MKCKSQGCNYDASRDLLYCDGHLFTCTATDDRGLNRCFNIAEVSYTENPTHDQTRYCFQHVESHTTQHDAEILLNQKLRWAKIDGRQEIINGVGPIVEDLKRQLYEIRLYLDRKEPNTEGALNRLSDIYNVLDKLGKIVEEK